MNIRRNFIIIGSIGLTLILLVALLLPHHPDPRGEWQSGHTLLPDIKIQEELVHIGNLRDFRYHPQGQIREVRYTEGSYHLSQLQQVWFGISHFGDHGLAHTFLSFEFAGNNYLTASIEARMRPDQSYHPIRGLLRQYQKIIVLGSEADIIGLRSHVRAERVLLYPLQLEAGQQQHLFRGILADAQALHQHPEFYNTLLDNCTTSLLRHDPQHRIWKALFDYRILLPGYSDAYAWERGWLNNDQELAELRRQALVDSLILPDDDHFSHLIRRNGNYQLSLALP